MAILLAILNLLLFPFVWIGRPALRKVGITNHPQIMVHSPGDRAGEKDIVWWHVQVENQSRRGPWRTKSAEQCTVRLTFLRIDDGSSSQSAGMWSAVDLTGPRAEIRPTPKTEAVGSP